MNLDRTKLNLVAPAMSVLGSLIAVLSALRARPRSVSSVLSSMAGLAGSTAWFLAAYQEAAEAEAELESA